MPALLQLAAVAGWLLLVVAPGVILAAHRRAQRILAAAEVDAWDIRRRAKRLLMTAMRTEIQVSERPALRGRIRAVLAARQGGGG